VSVNGVDRGKERSWRVTTSLLEDAESTWALLHISIAKPMTTQYTPNQ